MPKVFLGLDYKRLGAFVTPIKQTLHEVKCAAAAHEILTGAAPELGATAG